MDSELFWMLVGNKVQTHFLYYRILTEDEFKEILIKINKEEENNKNKETPK